MNLLGIGPLELLLILLLVVIIFGPKDLQKTGKAIGRGLNKLVHSAEWRAITQTSKELKNLPTRLMRDANLEEISQEIGQVDPAAPGKSRPATGAPVIAPPAIQPPKPAAPDTETHPDTAEGDHA